MFFDRTYIGNYSALQQAREHKAKAVPGFPACRELCLHYVLLALLLPSLVYADTILGGEYLDDTLRQMRQLTQQLQDTSPGSAQAKTTFALGLKAAALAELLSKEVSAHGEQQRPLLDSAVKRAAQLNIGIGWSSDHQRYFYDGAAFQRYLELAPEGRFAADSWFQTVQQDFYYADQRDPVSLTRAAARKQAFLDKFPQHNNIGKVGIFLGIDYRDIWRRCRELEDPVCAAHYRELTRGQLRKVAAVNAGTNTSEIAARMLRRFELELAKLPAAPKNGPQQNIEEREP